MKVLAKIDRFSQFPQFNLRGYPFASTSVGIMLTFCVIILLAVVFGFLVSTAVGNPTTTSVITQSYVETLDLVSADFRLCIADLSDSAYDTNGNAIGSNAITLQQIFEQDLETRMQVYTLSDANTRINRAFKYCPDRSASPVVHCICLNEESVIISPSDTFYAKVDLHDIPVTRNFDFFTTVPIKTLIPKKLTDPFLTKSKKYQLSDINRVYGSLGISLDRLIYKVDDNYFVATSKTTYSVLPKAVTETRDPIDMGQGIQGWSLGFTGQTLTTETTATKILSVLAQVGALNGVFVIVFMALFLPFFKLKYTENLLNDLNKTQTLAENNLKISPEDIELQETSPKERARTLVRKKTMSKKPLYIGFWEWLCSCYKRTSKIKALQENEIAIKKYSDIARVIRTKMDVELMKKVLLSPEQLHLLENIPFGPSACGQTDKKIRDTPEQSPLDVFELLRSQASKEDMQSRFVELMKKHYD